MSGANRYFAIAAFWSLGGLELALVNLSAEQIARFQFLRRQLRVLQAADGGVIQIVVDAQPVWWLDYNQALQERSDDEITEGEWDACLRARPEDIAQPATAHVHVTEDGLRFSCEIGEDNASTETITWQTLEQQS